MIPFPRALSLLAPAAAWFAVATQAAGGPYAPAAGRDGSTAVHMDEDAFVAWASNYSAVTYGSGVADEWKTPEKALGKAVGDAFDIVSLGRGGRITFEFESPITDGEGPDFAVFENPFSDYFLELGFVEVSSNGTDFVRFANDSQTAAAVGAFGLLNPTDITGYAGKYRQGYGTPFDLADCDGLSPDVDVRAIRYVRIVDIVGDGNTTDSSGDPIYDPHPTTGSAGLDVEALGVLNATTEVALYLGDHGLAGPDADSGADPDEDGVPNLREFAFGSDPSDPGSLPARKTRILVADDSLHFVLSVPVRAGGEMEGTVYAVDGLRYETTGSTDLETWDEPVEIVVNPDGLPPVADGYVWLSFRLANDLAHAARGFLRTQVTEQ